MSRIFLDTNVCVYNFDSAEPARRDVARRVLRSPDHRLVISTQVLQEFYHVTTRKLRRPLAHGDAVAAVEELCAFAVVPSDASLVQRAIRLVHEHPLSIWDALVVEAAVRGRCDVLYTEDLDAGGSIRGVEIVNPFE